LCTACVDGRSQSCTAGSEYNNVFHGVLFCRLALIKSRTG
jgi:hypothetical protein